MFPLPFVQLYVAPQNLRVICHHEVVSLETVHLCKWLLRYGGRCGRTRGVYDGMKLQRLG